MEDTPDHIKKFTAVLTVDGKEYTSIANRSDIRGKIAIFRTKELILFGQSSLWQ